MGWKMSVNTGNGDGGQFESCPAGEYAAVLVALIDLGTQQTKDFNDPTKVAWKEQVCCVWEAQGAATEKGEPFYFCEKYNASLHERAAFRAVLETGGVKVADDGEFDIAVALGKPYLLEVEDAVSGKGKEYTRLAKKGVRKLPKAMVAMIKPPTRPPFLWRVGDESLKSYNWLPYLYGKPLHEVVAASQEAGGRGAGDEGEAKAPAGNGRAHAAAAAPSGGGGDLDDVPF